MKATKTLVLIVLLLIPAINVHAWPIPDTGQTKCYNDTVEIPCPTPGQPFYGQDGNYTINPLSYTKLDTNGAVLPNAAATWAMVKDNVTGLIWENKTADVGIHYYSNQYTWCDKNPATNGGVQGTCGSGATPTDTEAFIKALNDAHFGGFSDWRMPTVTELLSIVVFSGVRPAIDATFFPIMSTLHWDYWSSTTNKVSLTSIIAERLAWCVSFFDGEVFHKDKYSSGSVRAVRGGQPESLNHFVDNGDGTVTDTATGLMWQQGTLPSGLTLEVPRTYWEAVLTYTEGLSLAGYDDWRMPTVKEFLSIMDFSRWNPAIDTTFFPDTADKGDFWSSTTSAFNTNEAWKTMFGFYSFCLVGDCNYIGNVYSDYKSHSYYVRAVRAGQSLLPGHLTITAPTQGDNWKIGQQLIIRWITPGIAGYAKISISRQGGKVGTFETIAESAQNMGYYHWIVTGPVSVNCVLKIEPLNDPSKVTSQGLFSISAEAGCSGDVVVLQNMTFVSGNTYNCMGTTSITAGIGVTVKSGATVNFRAPKISFQPGFKVESGAVFSAKQ